MNIPSTTKSTSVRRKFGAFDIAHPAMPALGMLARKTLLPKRSAIPGMPPAAMKAINARRKMTLTGLSSH